MSAASPQSSAAPGPAVSSAAESPGSGAPPPCRTLAAAEQQGPECDSLGLRGSRIESGELRRLCALLTPQLQCARAEFGAEAVVDAAEAAQRASGELRALLGHLLQRFAERAQVLMHQLLLRVERRADIVKKNAREPTPEPSEDLAALWRAQAMEALHKAHLSAEYIFYCMSFGGKAHAELRGGAAGEQELAKRVAAVMARYGASAGAAAAAEATVRVQRAQAVRRGMAQLEGATVGMKLRTLQLSDNHIGDAGTVHLAHMLHFNTTLTELGLSRASIGDEGAARLAAALAAGVSPLRRLDLSHNHLGDDGALCFAESFAMGAGLQILELEGTGASKAVQRLLRALQRCAVHSAGRGPRELGGRAGRLAARVEPRAGAQRTIAGLGAVGGVEPGGPHPGTLMRNAYFLSLRPAAPPPRTPRSAAPPSAEGPHSVYPYPRTDQEFFVNGWCAKNAARFKHRGRLQMIEEAEQIFRWAMAGTVKKNLEACAILRESTKLGFDRWIATREFDPDLRSWWAKMAAPERALGRRYAARSQRRHEAGRLRRLPMLIERRDAEVVCILAVVAAILTIDVEVRRATWARLRAQLDQVEGDKSGGALIECRPSVTMQGCPSPEPGSPQPVGSPMTQDDGVMRALSEDDEGRFGGGMTSRLSEPSDHGPATPALGAPPPVAWGAPDVAAVAAAVCGAIARVVEALRHARLREAKKREAREAEGEGVQVGEDEDFVEWTVGEETVRIFVHEGGYFQADTLCYTVNGERRPPIRFLRYDGLHTIYFPESVRQMLSGTQQLGRAVQLPESAKVADALLYLIRDFAIKTGVATHNLPPRIASRFTAPAQFQPGPTRAVAQPPAPSPRSAAKGRGAGGGGAKAAAAAAKRQQAVLQKQAARERRAAQLEAEQAVFAGEGQAVLHFDAAGQPARRAVRLEVCSSTVRLSAASGARDRWVELAPLLRVVVAAYDPDPVEGGDAEQPAEPTEYACVLCLPAQIPNLVDHSLPMRDEYDCMLMFQQLEPFAGFVRAVTERYEQLRGTPLEIVPMDPSELSDETIRVSRPSSWLPHWAAAGEAVLCAAECEQCGVMVGVPVPLAPPRPHGDLAPGDLSVAVRALPDHRYRYELRAETQQQEAPLCGWMSAPAELPRQMRMLLPDPSIAAYAWGHPAEEAEELDASEGSPATLFALNGGLLFFDATAATIGATAAVWRPDAAVAEKAQLLLRLRGPALSRSAPSPTCTACGGLSAEAARLCPAPRRLREGLHIRRLCWLSDCPNFAGDPPPPAFAVPRNSADGETQDWAYYAVEWVLSRAAQPLGLITAAQPLSPRSAGATVLLSPGSPRQAPPDSPHAGPVSPVSPASPTAAPVPRFFQYLKGFHERGFAVIVDGSGMMRSPVDGEGSITGWAAAGRAAELLAPAAVARDGMLSLCLYAEEQGDFCRYEARGAADTGAVFSHNGPGTMCSLAGPLKSLIQSALQAGRPASLLVLAADRPKDHDAVQRELCYAGDRLKGNAGGARALTVTFVQVGSHPGGEKWLRELAAVSQCAPIVDIVMHADLGGASLEEYLQRCLAAGRRREEGRGGLPRRRGAAEGELLQAQEQAGRLRTELEEREARADAERAAAQGELRALREELRRARGTDDAGR